MKAFLVFLFIVCLVNSYTSPRLIKSGIRASLSSKKTDIDPYDFLNLNELTQEGKAREELSITNESEDFVREKADHTGRRFINRKNYTEPSYRKWANWDNFMEEEFGDLDAELTGDESWIYDARDSIEQRRGHAIWSKRSAKDIQREVKKKLASRQLNIPESVNTLISAVYFDRTYTLKEIKKEQELTAIEYRIWMRETKGKLKKDPLPIAKVEVAYRWLSSPPTIRSSSQRVVMDDYISISDDGTTFSITGGQATDGQLANLITSSMLNWSKGKSDLPIVSAQAPGAEDGGTESRERGAGKFSVDGEEMFVSSSLSAADSTEYFVVI